MALAENVQLDVIAAKYEITGAQIVNIVHHCCLQALAAGRVPASTNGSGKYVIAQGDLVIGVQRELLKEGKLG